MALMGKQKLEDGRQGGDRPLLSLLTLLLVLLPLHSYYALYPLEIESDVRRGFAQRDGRSAKEFRAFAEFYKLPFEGLEIWVVLASPKKSLGKETIPVGQPLLDEILRLDAFVQNFTAPFRSGVTTFHDTSSGEDLNALLRYLAQIYPLTAIMPDVQIQHPVTKVFGHNLQTSSHFFMVNRGLPENSTLQTAQHVALWYMNKAENYEETKRLEAIELGLFQYFLKDDFSDLFSVEMFGDQVANAEMLRGTIVSVGLFMLGGALMVLFMLFMFRHLTWSSRIWMTVGAMLSPLLATLSTFSLLGWLGVRTNSIMCITPFLVLGIGVDDAFLLLHQWRRVRAEGVLRKDDALKRVFLHVGPSMAVTSLTNTLAFGIGIMNPAPQMSSFCLGTALAVLLDFIYEFAVFAPIMVMCYEERPGGNEKQEPSKWLPSWEGLVNLLFTTSGKCAVIAMAVLMYLIAGHGLRGMHPTFEPAKTFPGDSELVHALRSFEYLQTEYWPVNFVTKRVPGTWEEVAEWEKMVSSLENRDHCYGRSRTTNFLRQFYEGSFTTWELTF
ncbi:unnamed protein product, partial [Mesorhabditis spiculigera]